MEKEEAGFARGWCNCRPLEAANMQREQESQETTGREQEGEGRPQGDKRGAGGSGGTRVSREDRGWMRDARKD